jgi:hypothetical protein
MQSIEHHCYLVERPKVLLLELDQGQHWGSPRWRHSEHCFDSFGADRLEHVVGDQEELMGVKFEERVAPSLFLGYQSYLVEGAGLDVVASDVDPAGATSTSLAAKSWVDDVAAVEDAAHKREHLEEALEGIVAGGLHNTFGDSVVAG